MIYHSSDWVAPTVALVVMIYCLVLIVAGQQGVNMMHRATVRGTGLLATWIFGKVWRLLFVMVATGFDAVVTTALMVYRVFTLRRVDSVGDDAAGFLQRLNERVLGVLTR